MKIQYVASPNIHEREIIKRCIKLLLDHGIEIVDDGRDVECDMIMLHLDRRMKPHINENWLRKFVDHPIVVVERAAGVGMLEPVRKSLLNANVVGVVRNTLYANRTCYDRISGRYHVRLLRQEAGETVVEPKPIGLDTSHLEKLSMPFSICANPFIDRIAQSDIDWRNHRSIDVFFAGNTHFGTGDSDGGFITRHRQQAVAALRAISGPNVVCYDQAELDQQTYLHHLKQSKIVLSPWGWGDVCYREYEASLVGCVVIKPNTSFGVVPEDDAWKNCALDFSDLEKVVRQNLHDFDESLAERQQFRERILFARRPETIAENLAKVFRDGHNRAGY